MLNSVVVSYVTSSKERRKIYVPKVVPTHLLIMSVAKYMMKYCLSGSELCIVQAEWLIGSVADQKVELPETDGLPRERDLLEASPPLSAVLHSKGISRSSDFSERCWFFSCTWSSTSEWCLVALRIRKFTGLLVKVHICESCTWRGSSREVSKVLKLAKGLFFSSEKPSGWY